MWKVPDPRIYNLFLVSLQIWEAEGWPGYPVPHPHAAALQSVDTFTEDLLQARLHCSTQRYTEITNDPLLFKCCARNILTVHRETFTQYILRVKNWYIIFKRGRGEAVLVFCSLATVTSLCADLVTKSPKVGGTSTYFLHLSGSTPRTIKKGRIPYFLAVVWFWSTPAPPLLAIAGKHEPDLQREERLWEMETTDKTTAKKIQGLFFHFYMQSTRIHLWDFVILDTLTVCR